MCPNRGDNDITSGYFYVGNVAQHHYIIVNVQTCIGPTGLCFVCCIYKCVALRHKGCEGPFTLYICFRLRLRFILLQQIGCAGLNGSVHTVRLRQRHQLLYNLL